MSIVSTNAILLQEAMAEMGQERTLDDVRKACEVEDRRDGAGRREVQGRDRVRRAARSGSEGASDRDPADREDDRSGGREAQAQVLTGRVILTPIDDDGRPDPSREVVIAENARIEFG